MNHSVKVGYLFNYHVFGKMIIDIIFPIIVVWLISTCTVWCKKSVNKKQGKGFYSQFYYNKKLILREETSEGFKNTG